MAEKARLKKKSNGRAKKGHNSGVPQEVERRWLAKIQDGQAAVERAAKPLKSRKGELSSIYKAAKSEGVDIDAAKKALKLNKLDHLDVALEYSNVGRYLRMLDSPLGIQMELFKATDLPVAVQAAVEGKRAGLAGHSIDINPHTPGTEPFVAFVDAWHKGQEENRATLME
jgi:uncharacterized protein (UPF0335 family)